MADPTRYGIFRLLGVSPELFMMSCREIHHEYNTYFTITIFYMLGLHSRLNIRPLGALECRIVQSEHAFGLVVLESNKRPCADFDKELLQHKSNRFLSKNSAISYVYSRIHVTSEVSHNIYEVRLKLLLSA